MTFDWLPETKFHPPALPDDLVPRTALLDTLCDAASKFPVILLSAAAGSGKTVMLASLAQCSQNLPVAWFSLDAEDNEPLRFMRGIVAAIRQIAPDFGDSSEILAEGFSTSMAHNEVIRTSGALINQVLKSIPHPFILAFDDLHYITEPLLYRALDYLIEHLPAGMHLAIATRYDPPLALGRLRARRWIAEFRLDELRFGYDEARELLGEEIEQTVVKHLYQHTEGWAAGLVLLTSALRGTSRSDHTTLLEKVVRQQHLTFDYLADEVLNQQPEHLRSFLLQTSILEQLTAHNCAAVTGRTDAGYVLESLYRRNLFMSAVQHEPPIYRYHDLFSDFLERQLIRESPNSIELLHRRAAEADVLPSRAIHHYVAAKAWDDAATRIEQVGEQLVSQGMHGTLSRWLAAIPDSTYRSHPRSLYLRAACAMIQGDVSGIEKVLGYLLNAYDQAENHEHVTANLCALASLAFTQARFEEADRFVQQAKGHPARIDTNITLLMLEASIALFARNDLGAARRNLFEAVHIVRKSRSEEALLILVMYLGQEFTVVEGGLELLEAFCIEVEGDNTITIRLGTLDVLAFIHLRRGRLPEAIEAGKEALKLKTTLEGFPFLGLNAALTVSNVYLIQKDYQKAEHYLNIVAEQLKALPLNAELAAHAYFEYGRLYWLSHQLDRAFDVNNAMSEFVPRLQFANALRQILNGMLALSSQDYEISERYLLTAAAEASNAPIALAHGNPQIWLAYLYEQMRDFDRAMGVFQPLLAESERNNTPGLILQDGWICVPLLRRAASTGSHTAYARALLDLLGEPLGARTQKSVAGLTQREIEVIELIAEGASNRGIAEKLFLSQTTVKSHVAHVMNKLGVSSRTEIIAHARRLGIV